MLSPAVGGNEFRSCLQELRQGDESPVRLSNPLWVESPSPERSPRTALEAAHRSKQPKLSGGFSAGRRVGERDSAFDNAAESSDLSASASKDGSSEPDSSCSSASPGPQASEMGADRLGTQRDHMERARLKEGAPPMSYEAVGTVVGGQMEWLGEESESAAAVEEVAMRTHWTEILNVSAGHDFGDQMEPVEDDQRVLGGFGSCAQKPSAADNETVDGERGTSHIDCCSCRPAFEGLCVLLALNVSVWLNMKV